MLKYIAKRIAIFIPTLFVISLVTFYLSVNVPGDPVEQMLNSNSEMGSSANAQASEKAYIDKREQLRPESCLFSISALRIKQCRKTCMKFLRNSTGKTWKD
jgi:ABC-type dipeptide/oligopeptide/nickel transport system permease component